MYAVRVVGVSFNPLHALNLKTNSDIWRPYAIVKP